MTELGAGPRLDRNFDLDVGGTGDLESVSGSAELEKDLAFQTARSLEAEFGQISDEETASRLRTRVMDIILADTRVINVNRLQLTVTGEKQEELKVNAIVQTSDGEQDLVFEV